VAAVNQLRIYQARFVPMPCDGVVMVFLECYRGMNTREGRQDNRAVGLPLQQHRVMGQGKFVRMLNVVGRVSGFIA